MIKETSVWAKALLVQQGLHKILQEKSAKLAGTSNKDWEEIDLKAASTIHLYLANEVMYNAMDERDSYGIVVKVRDIIYDENVALKVTITGFLF